MAPSTTDGRPAFGTQAMGTRLAPDRWRRASLISTGPVAQLRPTTSTCMASSTVERGADLGPRQHAARELDGHLALQRDVAVQGDHGAPGAVDGRLDREHVELGLDQEQVGPALQQSERLLLVGGAELGVGDVPERGELRAGPHGAGHPAGPLGRRELVAHRARQLGRPSGQLAGAVGQAVLGQHDRRRAEGVGLDHVAADFEEGAVHLCHEVGTGLDEPLVAPLELGPAEVIGLESEQLQVGAHGAVEDDDPLAQGLQVGGCGWIEPAEQLRGGGGHPNRIPVAPRPTSQPR